MSSNPPQGLIKSCFEKKEMPNLQQIIYDIIVKPSSEKFHKAKLAAKKS
jgi:hypothetical protein